MPRWHAAEACHAGMQLRLATQRPQPARAALSLPCRHVLSHQQPARASTEQHAMSVHTDQHTQLHPPDPCPQCHASPGERQPRRHQQQALRQHRAPLPLQLWLASCRTCAPVLCCWALQHSRACPGKCRWSCPLAGPGHGHCLAMCLLPAHAAVWWLMVSGCASNISGVTHPDCQWHP